MSRRLILILSSFTLISTGCAKRPQSAPPTPPTTSRPAPPQAGAVWISGHYKWSGGKYTWVPGHWDRAQAGRHWVPGHWQKTPRGYRWVEGHWTGAASPAAPHKPPPRKPPRR